MPASKPSQSTHTNKVFSPSRQFLFSLPSASEDQTFRHRMKQILVFAINKHNNMVVSSVVTQCGCDIKVLQDSRMHAEMVLSILLVVTHPHTLPLKWRNITHYSRSYSFPQFQKKHHTISHLCNPKAQKTFQISWATHGLNKENTMK